MIQSLGVKGLNGQFDYLFSDDKEFKQDFLNLLKAESESDLNIFPGFCSDLNIFTGLNGCGKTTLLKLMWYLISGNIHRIYPEIPFETILIKTQQFSFSLVPFRARARNARRARRKIRVDWKRGKDIETYEENTRGFHDNSRIHSLGKKIASLGQDSLFFPTFRRIEGGFSIDSRNTVHTEEAAVVRLLSSTTEMLQTAMLRLSEDLSTNRHKFITAVSMKDLEKLLPLKKIEIADKVNELYAELSRRIGKEVPPSNTFQPSGQHAISTLEQIQEELLEAAKEREKLENRVTVLDEAVQIIFKREIQITEGIILGEKRESGRKKTAIHADKLSSGEKQMLGFLCYNAFSDNTAIFIDEPELSLHQDWQEILLPLLLKQETGNQFFIATHSELIYDQFPDKEFILNLEGN